MSVLNQSGEEQVECPLCMEPLEVDDLHFYPCTCGYQICRFCWNRIREGENGLCPACRKAYPENPADFTPLSQEQVAAIKTEKKAREAKRRNKTLESRRLLANVRVVQNNLVFVVGLPVRLADPEILKRQEYFGKYGKIHKVVINQSTTYAGSQGPSASAYVTYVTSADALRAIQGVNNVTLDGRVLKGSLGTTKYCANFMKNQPCPKPDCMYLHDLGDPKASFTKEEMHAGLHQVYERKLHNQLLASQRDPTSSSGNSSTNDKEKGSSKDGNPSIFIPASVVTSSHINVVNSSKSNKKDRDSVNGSSSSSSSSSNGKDAWPSLSSSPPLDCPEPPRKGSPQLHHEDVNKSEENCTSESSSPTHRTPPPATNKSKANKQDKPSRKESNGQPAKKSKSEKKKNNSININNEETDTPVNKPFNTQNLSVFENETQQYLTNELDELESDRHSLLENHDLLDNSDHSLLEDDNTHNLLNDANNDVIMMQRHRGMLTGLVDSNHMMPQMKSSLNGYGLLDRDMGYDRQINQMNQGLLEQKEMLLRERSRSEMLMRQNEMLARQHNAMVEPKHYMQSSSIGLESASELLGANFHPNPNMLPFGMRVDNSMGSNTMANNAMSNSMSNNPMGNSMGNSMGGAAGPHSNYMMHQTHMNGFDASHQNSEGRYLAENMDKFFTDFHKAQQLRQMARDRYSLHDDHKQRMNSNRVGENNAHHLHSQHSLGQHSQHNMHSQHAANCQNSPHGKRAAGDADDDLDFDPFKETQKALAEMMENEVMQGVSSGDSLDRVRLSRLPPPGFSHVPSSASHHAFPLHNHTGFTGSSTVFNDWTQMDPAIVSTTPGGLRPQQQQQQQHQQQHPADLFARFNQLSVQPGSNGVNKMQVPLASWSGGKLGWAGGMVPLPPGFAPSKPAARPAECVDAN